jgi:sugar lactone lactonase YvrE
MKYELATGQRNELGEGPVGDIAAGRTKWTDIYKREIHQYCPADNTHRVCCVGQKTGAVAVKRSGGFIARTRFAAINPEKQDIKM